ncbi:hypothetical protein RLDS_16820 [Sphingobium lactosutens DS20]|uniref:Uncharacterized protein n=1 Tax=Sphingobium lactosutens DS20 TaxID=1331060 RepID=T0HAQ5_9SPHN|nr:hypothetical protein RLDS_16820 [Sphingobium lactosutens DS20]
MPGKFLAGYGECAILQEQGRTSFRVQIVCRQPKSLHQSNKPVSVGQQNGTIIEKIPGHHLDMRAGGCMIGQQGDPAIGS